MKIGRVVGRVVATRRVAGLEGVRLLWLQPLDETLRESGPRLIDADAQQAGPGDLVHWIGGREASMALPDPFVPVDAAVTGHVEPTSSHLPA